jgi:hypothetical protein
MKNLIFATMILATTSYGTAATNQSFNFDKTKPAEISNDWLSGFYGPKGELNWQVVEDPTSPSKPSVLKHLGKATYTWFVRKDLNVQDGEIEADFNIQSGVEDPEAGLVWRHQDGKNYYYVRTNSKRDNVVFYRMRDGTKELIKLADNKVPQNTWHHLKVKFQGDQIKIFMNQKPLIELRDSTFKNSGRVGFFTTADTVAAFDNLTVVKEK